jgi:hypothetical protein
LCGEIGAECRTSFLEIVNLEHHSDGTWRRPVFDVPGGIDRGG